MEHRGRIWAQTLVVIAVWTTAIVLVDRRLFAHLARPLALALSFVLVQSVGIAVMLAILLTRRGIASRRSLRSLRVGQAAANAIAEHAAGADRMRVLRELRRESRADVDRALAAFVSGTRGTMQERVTVLARDLGATSSALLHREETRTLFDRILLAEETRSRATELAATDIARALASDDEAQMIAALDLLRAWRVVLNVPNFERALTHPSEEVRYRAMLALPHVAQALLPALDDPSPEVRAAAAHAAGKQRLFHPALETLLDDNNHEVAIAAAFALAMTEQGRDVLQSHVTAGHRVAFEALEKATMGRLELA